MEFNIDRDSFVEKIKQNYPKVNNELLSEITDSIIAADKAYQKLAGIDENGGFYDDDDAYDYIVEAVCADPSFEGNDLLVAAVADDYMEQNEQYLTELGLIDWD